MTSLRVAVLVTVHNRAATTVRGLSRLAALARRLPDLSLSVFLVDDGSEDDTVSQVRGVDLDLSITQGNGSLYWNRGMVQAYQTARQSGREFDAYMLFNDDVLLDDEFLRFVAEYRKLDDCILVGAFTEPSADQISYSGYRRLSWWRPLSFVKVDLADPLVPVDAFNGNLVLIPAATFEALGGLDPRYTHAYGDLDLGLRAKSLSVKSFVYGVPIGTCARGRSLDERIRAARIRDRWRLLFEYPHGLNSYLRFASVHCPPTLVPLYAVHEILRRAMKLMWRRAPET